MALALWYSYNNDHLINNLLTGYIDLLSCHVVQQLDHETDWHHCTNTHDKLVFKRKRNYHLGAH